jgi:hypothetical protein
MAAENDSAMRSDSAALWVRMVMSWRGLFESTRKAPGYLLGENTPTAPGSLTMPNLI